MISVKNIGKLTGGLRVAWTAKTGLRVRSRDMKDWLVFPADFHMLSECPRTAEDPDTPHLSAIYRLGTQRCDSYVKPPIFITKVMTDAKDTLRAVFTSHEQVIPAMFVDNGVGADFTEIDSGKWLTIRDNGQYYSIAESLDEPLSSICKKDNVPMTLKDIDLEPFIERYLKEFRAGEQALFPLGCVVFNSDTMTMAYNDSIVEFPDLTSMMAALDHLRDMCDRHDTQFVDVYDNVIYETVTRLEETALVINGTRIRYEIKESASGAKLQYINNRKICDPDIKQVILHVLCCPSIRGMDGNTVYTEYLDQVSKVSMKFHRAVMNGIDMKLSTDHLHNWKAMSAADKDGKPAVKKSDIRQPGHGSHGGRDDTDHYIEFKLKVSKTLGKKSEVTILDKVYHIDNLDGFIMACEETQDYRYGKYIKRKTPEAYYQFSHMAADPWWKKLAKKLCAVEAYLVEDILNPKLVSMDRQIQESCWVDGNYGHRNKTVHAFVCHEANDKTMQAWSNKIAETCKTQMSKAQDVLERSYELFKDILKDTGAKEVKRKEDGKYEYHITGKSGTRYAVDEGTAMVYTNIGGDIKDRRHICIVKGNGGKIAGYDYLGSVLAALSDDSVIATHVHTLESVIKDKGKVEKHAA